MNARFGDAEIHDLHGSVRPDLDVWPASSPDERRRCYGGIKSFRDLSCNRQRFTGRDRPALKAIRQGRALDKLQNQRAGAFALLQSIDGAKVR
jgi:hypothetical protein